MGRLLIFLAMVYGVLCVALYFMQQSFIYFPQQRHRLDVPLLKLAAGDDTILVTSP